MDDVVCKITKEHVDKNIHFMNIATELINKKYNKKQKRNIWHKSKWKNINELENDDIGRVGEEIVNHFCHLASIKSDIDGMKTKQQGGGNGDGTINGRTVEIKTARLGSNGLSFQHELGETPWKSDYMIFLDIAPDKMYITIFSNFSEEFYKKSGCDSSNKCKPYFPSKSIIWRKQKGSFKLDTTKNMNEKNEYTFKIYDTMNDYSTFTGFVNKIISPM